MDNEYIINNCIEIIKKAGEIGKSFYKNPFTGYDLKDDSSFVTIADKKIEDYLREEIKSRFEGIIIGEEGSNPKTEESISSEYVWAIDPIDGTHSFAMKLPGWCISLGLVKNGNPYFGMIYAPVFDELYYGGPEFGAFLNHTEINSCLFRREHIDYNDTVCIDSKSLHEYNIDIKAKVRSFGSTALHIVFAARGAVNAAHVGRVKIWDIAGALPIALASGCNIVYKNFDEFLFSDLLKDYKLKDDIFIGPNNFVKILRDKMNKIDS